MLAHALEIGISVEVFWSTTPRELQMHAQAYFKRTHREALFLAWHVAALSRTQRLPSLESLLLDPPTEDELRIEREEAERMHRQIVATHERARAQAQADG
ncbi:MAG: hypothetical protein WBQ86_12680 [Candidatus Binatus sp.]